MGKWLLQGKAGTQSVTELAASETETRFIYDQEVTVSVILVHFCDQMLHMAQIHRVYPLNNLS